MMKKYISRVNTFLAISFVMLFPTGAFAQVTAPKIFTNILDPNKLYEGQRVVVTPPEEIEKYIKLVKEGAKNDPEWYEEYSKNAKPGVPLPFHKNLNLTTVQYQEYLELWGKREFKILEKIGVLLELRRGKWCFRLSGTGAMISLLRYDEKEDVFRSTNGVMKRIDDIDAGEETILGEWKGAEWRFEEETPLGKTKENLALGKAADGKFGFLVYRLQDITANNTVLEDVSRVIRFPLK
ncbi:hypothetical protein OAL08_02480 [Akkermansiaceae bacterium]|nr:hypothetical protein [Akkermansiaceae bacterium]